MSDDFIPYRSVHPPLSDTEIIELSKKHNLHMQHRRSVRNFSDQPIPEEVIDNIIDIASSAPSGAHKQPWTFCMVSNPDLKKRIREAAEKEEYENYHGRMTEEWLDDLKVFGTDWHKEFLEVAPYLIIVFKKSYDINDDGSTSKNYYVNESVGIACGFLLQAIHEMGLVSLTHTPSPMNFLANLLQRPKNEKAYLLIPIGYPSEKAQVPVLERKSLDQVLVKYT
ncbi:MAG: nitroreductase family protein [Bacteroidia bacterium]|nr:nitroreductase family protein [Bacteroidia bacterium]